MTRIADSNGVSRFGKRRMRLNAWMQRYRAGDGAVCWVVTGHERGEAQQSETSTGAAGATGRASRKPSPDHGKPPPWPMRGANGEAGFTLVEVLVVLSIIGLVVGLIGPRVVGYLNDAKFATARIQATTLSSAVELFFIDNGRYPLDAEGLQALISPPANLQSWNGPYLKATAVPRDPWGKPYHYAVHNDGRSFVIGFVGSERRGGGEGNESQKRYSATRGTLPR